MCDRTLADVLVFDIGIMGRQSPNGSVEFCNAFVRKHLGGITGEIPKIACPICKQGVLIETERGDVFSEPTHLGEGISQEKASIPIGRSIRLRCSECQKVFSGKRIFLTVA
ncbi:MAG: hypothetical protein WC242_02010 [Candidatus Paceibacterota bacterium]|jgi:hypothetical protein